MPGGLLRDRQFRLLWSGQAVSSFGDGLTSIALLVTSQRLTGSTAAVAATAIAIALPQLAIGLFAGVIVDRWSRRRVMIVADLLRAVLVLGFLVVTSADLLWLLYMLAFAQSAIGTVSTRRGRRCWRTSFVPTGSWPGTRCPRWLASSQESRGSPPPGCWPERARI
jgi:MFS family permease